MTRKAFLWTALTCTLLLAACQTTTSTPHTPTAVPTPASAQPPTVAAAETSLAAVEPSGDADTAANADVEYVRAVEAADDTWTFHVTVRHPDTGWEDYADGWDVLTPDGTVLKTDPDGPFTRLLLHPHEDEQPFTRSHGGIVIPAGVDRVRVRAHDLVDGFGGREVLVDLTSPSGTSFEIVRTTP
jgi:hypothetical protein